MKFPTDRPVKVVMLGAGGTGGYPIRLRSALWTAAMMAS